MKSEPSMAVNILNIKQSKGGLKAMSKEDFIAILEATLLCANLDIIGLSLVDDNNVLITFKGNGTRKVNIEADSYGAIIVDVMKHAF